MVISAWMGGILSRKIRLLSIFIVSLLLISQAHAQSKFEDKYENKYVGHQFNHISEFNTEVWWGDPIDLNRPIMKAIVRLIKADGATGCTGIMISEDVLLTAGHCVRTGIGTPNTLVKSYAEPNSECSLARSEGYLFHPTAHSDGILMLPDFALVKLDRKMCGIKPALLEYKTQITEGLKLWTSGFGQGTQGPLPDELELQFLPQNKEHMLSLYQTEDEDWQKGVVKIFEKFSPYYKFALPATKDGATICGGDSGGPVFIEREQDVVLYGLNGAFFAHPSKGLPACNNAYLQLITSINPYMRWINRRLLEWSGL